MAGKGYLYSAGDRLPGSTGEMVQLSWGNFGLHWGNGSAEVSVFRRGTILDQDFRGCLLGMSVYSAGEC